MRKICSPAAPSCPTFKITSFQVTGLTDAFSNSVVAATTLGSVSLKSVPNSTNGPNGILGHVGIASSIVLALLTYNKAQPTPQVLISR